MTQRDREMRNKIKRLDNMEKHYFMMFYVAVKEYEILEKIQDIFNYYEAEEHQNALDNIKVATQDYAFYKEISEKEAEQKLWAFWCRK